MSEETHTTIFRNEAVAVSYHWRSTTEVAKYLNKTRRRVVQMCTDGTFAAAEMPVYRDVRRRWWIALPEDRSEQTA